MVRKTSKNKGNNFEKKDLEKALITLKRGDYFFEKKIYKQAETLYFEAISILENLIYLKKKNVFLFTHLGIAYHQLGKIFIQYNNFDKVKEFCLNSIDSYKQGIKIKNDYPIIHNNLGNVQITLGQFFFKKGLYKKAEILYFDAINTLKKSIELKNDYDSSYNNLGLAYQALGELSLKKENFNEVEKLYITSIENYKKAIKFNKEKKNKFFYNNLAATQNILGQFLHKNNSKNFLAIEQLYLNSIENLKEAIKLDSNYINAYSNLGFTFHTFGKFLYKINNKNFPKVEKLYLKAIETFNKIINLNGSYGDSYNYLGNVYLDFEDIYYKNNKKEKSKISYFKAVENYEKAIICCPKNAAYHFNIGNIYLKNNKIELSIKIFEKIVDLDRQSKIFLFYLGQTLLNYLKEKKIKEKTKIYLENLKKNPKNIDYNQPIEKFLKNKCYFLIKNLKEIENLENYMQKYLKENIEKKIQKDFKRKVKRFKIEKTEYNSKYYMYKNCDGHLFNNLEEKKIWKGKPSTFNDPFDPYYKQFKTIINNELNKIRISCFTEKYDNLLMWAHYAENHKGICIGYKLKETLDEFTCFEKVIYKELKTHKEIIDKNLSSIQIDEEILTINEMCLRKHKDWKYENEWRVINLNGENNFYENVNICEIYFGIECTKEHENDIIKIFKENTLYKNNQIKFYKMLQGNNLTLKKELIYVKRNKSIKI